MNDELTNLVRKIHDLLELLAEEKIGERDAKQRTILREIVGSSPTKQKSVLLMNGEHSQAQIHKKTGVHRGNLSTLVSKLHKAKLLTGDTKMPLLSISIPKNFFDSQ